MRADTVRPDLRQPAPGGPEAGLPPSIRPAPLPRPAGPPGRGAGRGGQVYRGLPGPVRLVGWSAIAVALGATIGGTAPTALRELGAVAYEAPGMLAWYAVRATGFLAFFAVSGSVAYGLLLSTKLLDIVAHRPVTYALHRDLALAGLALASLHAILLLADRTYPFTPVALLVPFASPYAPVEVGVGQVAFLVTAVVTASFYARRQIGQRAWRLIHYVTFLAFLGVAAHGITSGSDTRAPWALWAYLVPVATVVFLFVYRVVTGIADRRDRGAAGHGQPPPPGPLVRYAPKSGTSSIPAHTTPRGSALPSDDVQP